MSIATSANLVTSGLLVNIDSFNPNSYVGPPMQNVASTIANSYNSTSASFYMVPGYERVNIPTVGVVNSLYMDMYNNYPAVSGDCCPAPINFGYDLVVSPSTLYTYAILYKSANRYTHPNYMYRYEYTSGGSYVSEAGIHSTSNEVHLGNDWYWAWGTFTTSATTGKVSPRAFMYQYTTYNRLYIAKVLLTSGNYTALHPKKWPDPGTTRSISQALVNLSRKGSVTGSNLTYDTAGNFTNGLYTYTPSAAFNLYCLDFWMYNNNVVPNNDSAIGGPTTYQTAIAFNGGGTYGIHLGGWTAAATNEAFHIWSATPGGEMTYNRDSAAVGWHNVVFNWNGSTYDIWLDGVKTTTYAHNTGGHAKLVNITTLMYIRGNLATGYYFNGQIPVVKCYNRQLSDREVLQNFNALRGRYSI